MDELLGYVLLEAMDGYSSREWPEQSRRITREVSEMVKRIQAEAWDKGAEFMANQEHISADYDMNPHR